MSEQSIYGVWKHETTDHGTRMVTIQTIREDGTYETHMIVAMEGGCEQHIHHYGTVEVSDGSLKLSLHSGRTKMTGCEDPSENFALRDFEQAEIAEATALLAREIPFSIGADRLTTTVSGPMGEMEVTYDRQSD